MFSTVRLTNAFVVVYRFYVVNNLSEPRVRKMSDVVDWPNVNHVPPWSVLASERHAKIVMASPGSGFLIDGLCELKSNIEMRFSM